MSIFNIIKAYYEYIINVNNHLYRLKNMWEFKFDAPVGLRTMRGFDSVTTYPIYDDAGGYEPGNSWYVEELNKWTDIANGYDASSHHNVYNKGKNKAPRTFKAFKNYLNRHPELKSMEVVLVNSQYYPNADGLGKNVGMSISAFWKEA